jgi:hypothetical protein
MSRQLRASRTILLGVACLIASTGFVSAEAPPRSALQQNLFVTRIGYFEPVGEHFGGIWELNPVDATLTRIRSFLPTSDTDRVIPHGFWGQDGFLATFEDTLVYETWPADIEFDAFSWRMIRRIPGTTHADDYGWANLGPFVTGSWASALGLAEGRYGIARCELRWVTIFWEAPPLICSIWPFDGGITENSWGTDQIVFFDPHLTYPFSSVAADLGSQVWAPNLLPPDPPPTLSIDIGRGGFWRASPKGASLFPVEEGEFQPANRTVTFDLPALDREDVEIDRLFYHPTTDTFFGTAQSVDATNWGDDRFFFRANPDTGVSELLGSWERGEDLGAPTTFASFGPAPDHYVQTVPIVGGGPGVNDTNWTTELWVFNPADASQHVTLRRVTHPEEEFVVDLPPRGSFAIDDVLSWVGGGASGDGTAHEALVVTSDAHWGEQLVVFGRIWTADPASGGRFGHAVPAVPGRIGYSNHIHDLWGSHPSTGFSNLYNVHTPGLDHSNYALDLRSPDRYRYNIGVVNDSDGDIQFRMFWAATGPLEGNLSQVRPPETIQTIDVPAHGVRLVSLESLFPRTIRETWAPRIAITGDRPAIVWMSMVDNLTGDATFVPYTSFSYFNDEAQDRLVLPVAAHVPGKGGIPWRTDLFGYTSFITYYSPLDLIFHPGNDRPVCGGTAPGLPIASYVRGELGMDLHTWYETLVGLGIPLLNEDNAADGLRLIYTDIIRRLDGCADETNAKGALEISAGSWFSGFSRTYTERPDGGTYGSMLPLYPPGGWPVQHFAGLVVDPSQRINVGLYNGIAERDVTHRLRLYATDGTLLVEHDVVLAPHEHRQQPLHLLLGVPASAIPDGLYGLTVIPLDDGAEHPGRSWAYVSIVDNKTNDPINMW